MFKLFKKEETFKELQERVQWQYDIGEYISFVAGSHLEILEGVLNYTELPLGKLLGVNPDPCERDELDDVVYDHSEGVGYYIDKKGKLCYGYFIKPFIDVKLPKEKIEEIRQAYAEKNLSCETRYFLRECRLPISEPGGDKEGIFIDKDNNIRYGKYTLSQKEKMLPVTKRHLEGIKELIKGNQKLQIEEEQKRIEKEEAERQRILNLGLDKFKIIK